MQKYRLTILVLAMLAPIFVAGAIASFRKYSDLADEFSRQSERLTSLTAELENIRANINYFLLDANIEREARKRLGLVKKGEITVIFVSPKPSEDPPPQSQENMPFLARVLNWIRNRK